MRFSFSSSRSSSTTSKAPVSAPATPQPAPPSPGSSEKISIVSEAPPWPKPSSSPPPLPTSSILAPPRCRKCSKPCTLLATRSSNRSGNAGRPYYKCVPDDLFVCFVGDRGVAEANPACECGVSSRRQLSSPEKGRKIFYKCKTGACDFFQFHQRADGSEWEVDEDVAKALAELKVV